MSSEVSSAPASTGKKAAGNPFPEEGLFPWYHFVMRSSAEGRSWVERYRGSECQELRQAIDHGLQDLRQHRLEEGRQVLEESHAQILRMEGEPAGLPAVMERWYFTAHAYYHYLVADFEAAAEELDQAQHSVEVAIGEFPMLLPFAQNCQELLFQHIRLARRRRAWELMQQHIESLGGLMEERLPLCCPRGGEPVYLATLERFLRSLPEPSADETAYIDDVFDPELRRKRIQSFARQVYALPGVLIQYP